MDAQNSTLEILDKVNGFYDSAWTRLIVVSSILIAIIGVLIPFLINWFQNRSLKIREDAIRNEFKLEFIKIFEELSRTMKEDFQKLVEEKIAELNDEFEKSLSNVDAGTFHIQANNSLKHKEFSDAILSYLSAGRKYIQGGDFNNLSRVNDQIESNLKYLSKLEILEIEEDDDDGAISGYLNLLATNNANGIFTDTISNIRKEFKRIKSS